MVLHITDSNKRYRLRSCPHCGGRLYWDEEEKEWRCLNCARPPERPISTTDNPQTKAIEKIPVTPTIAKRGEAPLLAAPGPENKAPKTPKLYERHSIDGIWWPPGKITFRRREMLFLIKNLPELREGYWPASHDGSGYIDLPIVRKGRVRSHKAPFVTAEYAAEVETRLERAGLDGLILEAIESWDKSAASMASYLRIPEWSIRKRAKNTLRYISGWKRKKQSYKEFISHKV